MYSKDYYESGNYNPETIGIKIFQKISQFMPYMVLITKAPDFKLLYANRKVSEFLGFDLDDLHKMDGRIWDRMEKEDVATLLEVAEKTQQIEDGKALKMNIKLKSKEGQTVYIETSISVFQRDQSGTPSEYICIAEDVTEKVLLEARARELEIIEKTLMKNIQKSLEAKITELAKAYEEVEQFSYVASHDLKEPLRKITAFGERLKEKCTHELSTDCALYVDRIIDGTNRMRILIESLLTLSRTKRNVDYFKPTNLNEILNEVVADLDNRTTAMSATINHPTLPVIEAIPTQMHQLFLNLLTNSLKFAKENVRPVIHVDFTYLTENQKDEYSLDTQRDYLHIQVRDNGIGFEPTAAETIFLPFKRLHLRSEYEGTGIGLAICKKVAQNHQGMIWADSSIGNGATFHVILAVQQPPVT